MTQGIITAQTRNYAVSVDSVDGTPKELLFKCEGDQAQYRLYRFLIAAGWSSDYASYAIECADKSGEFSLFKTMNDGAEWLGTIYAFHAQNANRITV